MFKCACGGEYRCVPDEEAEGMPPSVLARQFHCENCQGTDWLEPFYFGMDDWSDERTGL